MFAPRCPAGVDLLSVVIYEPNPRGHRLHHVALIASGLLDLRVTPTWVTTGEAADAPEVAVHLQDVLPRMVVEPAARTMTGSTSAEALARFRDVRDLSQRSGVERVFVPYADHIAQAVALPLAWPSSGAPVDGLMFRPRFAYPRERMRDGALAMASLRAATHSPWARLFFLDPLAVEFLEDQRSGSSRAVLMPEPVEQLEPVLRDEARASLGIDTDGPVIALVGVIDARKGALELASAFAKAALPSDAVLAFIGKVSDDVRSELRAVSDSTPSVMVLDQHLNEGQFWSALCAADILAATYQRHVGSSGIVARAAYLGTPLLASDFGWVGEATRRYGLGRTVNTSDAAAMVRAIEELVGSGRTSTRSELSAPFVEFNTPERFTETWVSPLRSG